jgi:pimeloyl-ACP methyl ester carboxylesterase
MDQLGLDKVSVMGVSLGGWIAADMAATEPNRFDRIVLVDAAGLRPRGDYPDYFMLTPVELAERVYATDNMRESMVAFMTDMESDSEIFGTYHRNRASTAHLAFNPYMHDTQLPTRLHRVKADTLVGWGAKDGILPLETSDAWLQAIPSAKRIVIDEAGHLPHIEQRERFLTAVSPFFGI